MLSMHRSTLKPDSSSSSAYASGLRRIASEFETAAVRIEDVIYSPGLCIPRHSHESANLIFIVAGVHWSGHSRGGEMCLCRTVRFLPAGETHENYFPVESRCLHIELRQSMLDLASEHGTTISVPGQIKRACSTALGEQIHREFRHQDSEALVEIEAAILSLLLADETEDASSGPVPRWLFKIREILHDEPHARRSLTDLSRQVGRHPVQVSRQFHQYFGCTIGEYTRRIRIAQAQSLLSRLDLDVSDIALASGFCDQSHFTNMFRRITGMSPGRYRMLISGKPIKEEGSQQF
jgi:AraC family transcriptional regulator